VRSNSCRPAVESGVNQTPSYVPCPWSSLGHTSLWLRSYAVNETM